MTLRGKFILLSNVVLWFTGAAVLLTAHRIHKTSLEENFEDSWRQQTVKWQTVCREAVADDSPRFMANFAQLLELQPDVRSARFYGADGRMAAVFRGWGGPQGLSEESASPDVRIMAADVFVKNARVGRAVMEFSQSYRRRTIAEGMLVAWIKILFVVAVLAAFNIVAVGLFTDRLTADIELLRAAAAEIEKGNFSCRLPGERKDELQFLSGHFNRMAQRLGELDNLKDDFIATVSHDLRNPLAAMKMHADVLLSPSPGQSNWTPVQRRFLAQIQDVSSRMIVHVTTILDAAKMKAGRVIYQLAPVAVGPVVQGAVALFSSMAEGFELSLEAEVPEQLPAIRADPDHLNQVLSNLIANALKFTPKHGRVTVRAAVQEPGWVDIAVADTGRGMSEEEQKQLFAPFTQFGVREHNKASSHGTGLGLYTVKQAMAGMGGTVSVRSKPDEGSCFTLRFQAMPAPAP